MGAGARVSRGRPTLAAGRGPARASGDTLLWWLTCWCAWLATWRLLGDVFVCVRSFEGSFMGAWRLVSFSSGFVAARRPAPGFYMAGARGPGSRLGAGWLAPAAAWLRLGVACRLAGASPCRWRRHAARQTLSLPEPGARTREPAITDEWAALARPAARPHAKPIRLWQAINCGRLSAQRALTHTCGCLVVALAASWRAAEPPPGRQ